MVSDIIIVAVFVLFILIGIKRGLAKSLLGIIALIVSFVSAKFLSHFLAQSIYDTFLKQTVTQNVSQYVSTSGIDMAMSKGFSALPDWANGMISSIVSFFGGSFSQLEQLFRKSSGSALSTTANTIESTVEAVSVTIFMIIIMSVLFLVIFILAKMLTNLIAKVFRLPVIRQIDMVFGAILGAAEGVIIIWFAINIFAVVESMANPQFLSNTLVDGWLFELLRFKY